MIDPESRNAPKDDSWEMGAISYNIQVMPNILLVSPAVANASKFWVGWLFPTAQDMHRLITNLLHLIIQQPRHPNDSVPILWIVINAEQLQRILLTIKQLPLLVLLATRARTLYAQILTVTIYSTYTSDL
jgi:hypothetical protein